MGNRKSKKIKFFEIYNVISDTEKSEFHSFLAVHSPGKFPVPKPVIENLTKPGFPELLQATYNHQTLWNICSELTKSIEQFLALKELMSDPVTTEKLFLDQAAKRNLKKITLLGYKLRLKKLHNGGIGIETAKQIANLSNDLCNLCFATDNPELKETLKIYWNYKFISLALESVREKINMVTAEGVGLKSEKLIAENIYRSINLSQTLSAIKEEYPDYHVLLRIYIDIETLLKNGFDSELYFNVKKSFYRILKKLSTAGKIDLCQLFVNCLTLFSGSGKINLKAEVFEFLKLQFSVSTPSDYEENMIGGTHFREVAMTAVNVGEVKWAEEFLEKNVPYLPADIRENELNTMKSYIEFHKGNFEEAIRTAGRLKKKSYVGYYDYYTISIRSNFELERFEECIVLLEKFNDYLRKNRNIPVLFAESSKRFVRNVRRLVNYKFKSGKKYLDEIEFEFNSERNGDVNGNNWIKNKLEELSS